MVSSWNYYKTWIDECMFSICCHSKEFRHFLNIYFEFEFIYHATVVVGPQNTDHNRNTNVSDIATILIVY